ncbi:SRPBCC family protein [Candidatus Poriferisocius sp.]|uniref:SRPBCC family protein n=1 Tax=Candidatus Poriferisocius sp. TaxID=3101276 RepID=UPI003B517D66
MRPRLISDSRVIPAPPGEIFALLADPSRHPEIDGSGTVQQLLSDPGPMQLGSEFRMAMKIFGCPYKMTNTVVEFEENRLIAWRHWGRHRWRYELDPADGGTLVTETADYSRTRLRQLIMIVHTPKRLQASIAATLDNLVKRFTP